MSRSTLNHHGKKKSLKGKTEVASPKTGLPPEAYDRIPRVQLTFTDEVVWLTRFDPDGEVISTYPVKLEHAARAFTNVPAVSGFLPRDALFWEYRNNSARHAIYLPPQRRALQFHLKRKPETFTLPLPGFVFVGSGKSYDIYAVLETPSALTQLYRAPLPNVGPEGSVCTGNVQFPMSSAETIHQAAEIFFGSEFNAHLDAQKLRDPKTKTDVALLPTLRALSERKVKKFPTELLIPHCPLAALMSGNRHEVIVIDYEEGEEEIDDGPYGGEPEVVENMMITDGIGVQE